VSSQPRLRPELPFRRIALVLSGGGALGAYEVGVFRTLESLGLEPRILAGVSVGAINAVVWVAHGFRSDALRETWRRMRPAGVGIRWATLGARALGAFVVALAAFEALNALANLPPLRLLAHSRLLHRPLHLELQSLVLETLAWAVVAAMGVLLILLSRRLEDLLVRLARPEDPGRPRRWFSRFLLVVAALYVATAPFDIPWPRRFHTTLLGVGALVWVLTRPGRTRGSLRRVVLRLFPETRGRGLWRGGGRRRLIEGLVRQGQPARLLAEEPHIIISACAVDTGRMHYFINWADPSAQFRHDVGEALGEVTPVRTVGALLDAAVASSAVPVVFEPERIAGRDFLDGGVFSNQPLHAVMADGADALLLVLVSPSDSPPRLVEEPTLMEVAARLPQLANWRDLQTELRRLPREWTRDGDPARVCVVEPMETLPGSLLGFDPENAEELMRRGEADAWRALGRAGWLEHTPGSATPA
jgi:predicted acylesterase/phospholipase RssA